MAVQKQDDQLELTYSNYVRTQDVTLKTCRRRCVIGRSGKRGSGISVLAARHYDDDDDFLYSVIFFRSVIFPPISCVNTYFHFYFFYLFKISTVQLYSFYSGRSFCFFRLVLFLFTFCFYFLRFHVFIPFCFLISSIQVYKFYNFLLLPFNFIHTIRFLNFFRSDLFSLNLKKI